MCYSVIHRLLSHLGWDCAMKKTYFGDGLKMYRPIIMAGVILRISRLYVN